MKPELAENIAAINNTKFNSINDKNKTKHDVYLSYSKYNSQYFRNDIYLV